MRNEVQSAKCKVQRKGFTLIELLVVISVIGILAALFLARFGTAEKSARDSRRKSDLNQYRTALENYGIKTGGVYPVRTTAGNASTGEPCTTLSGTYLSVCPQDPRQDETYFYRYQTDAGGLNYILWARMETGTGATNYWYLCSSGKSSEKQSTPAASDCGF
ncbi:MAG: type II secretion system protein [Patescibacteria group bacterium]